MRLVSHLIYLKVLRCFFDLLILKSFRRNSLFVEGLVVSAEFALAQDASLPPCRQESATIAHQLGKRCSDTQYANLQTLILFGTADN